MKILLVHDYYVSTAPSGENKHLDLERNLFTSRGHKVDSFTRFNDDLIGKGIWGSIKGSLSTPWNPFSAVAIRRKVDEFKPDVVHVHNTFPLISPSIFHAIGNKAARVLHLHNYRLYCPAAIPVRGGKTCTECLDQHSVWPSLKYGCYRGSRIDTIPLAFGVALHRFLGTWTKEVDAFIVLSEFQKNLMVKAGLPEEKVHVKPHFFPGNPTTVPWTERVSCVVFAGRLTREKGVETLVRAWKLWGKNAPELLIAGDGPLRKSLEQQCDELPIRYLGKLSSAETYDLISRSKLLIMPSECIEVFGFAWMEAFAHGTPAAVSAIDPLQTMIKDGTNGLVFDPADPESLMMVVRKAWERPELLENMGREARKSWELCYTEEMNYQMFMSIYEKAIERKKG